MVHSNFSGLSESGVSGGYHDSPSFLGEMVKRRDDCPPGKGNKPKYVATPLLDGTPEILIRPTALNLLVHNSIHD